MRETIIGLTKIVDQLEKTSNYSPEDAYWFGYQSEYTGPNEENIHFTIFSNDANTRAWNEGVADAKKAIERELRGVK